MERQYPCAIDCYRLVARDGKPPHPEDDPIVTAVVHSDLECEETKKQLLLEHPGGWVMERPLDVR